jgi:uncharacterized phage protein (TIGR02218 family)
MTFATYEESVEDGRPIRFYRFTLGATVWRYTSADEDLTIGGELWKRRPISDDGIKQTGDATTDALNITGPNNIGPVVIYMSGAPQTPIKVEVIESHVGLTVLRVIYVGEVVQVNSNRPGSAVITCQSLSASMRRQGLRLGWSRTCDYAHYDPLTCKVSKAAFAVAAVVQSVNGFVVTMDVTGPGNGFFTGGFAEWVHPVRGFHAVTIESHTGAQMTMFDDTSDMHEGMQLTLYPGCARTEAACRVFNNILNYGGCSKMPGKSPFDGFDTPFF